MASTCPHRIEAGPSVASSCCFLSHALRSCFTLSRIKAKQEYAWSIIVSRGNDPGPNKACVPWNLASAGATSEIWTLIHPFHEEVQGAETSTFQVGVCYVMVLTAPRMPLTPHT
jgi:hypothetical protein